MGNRSVSRTSAPEVSTPPYPWMLALLRRPETRPNLCCRLGRVASSRPGAQQLKVYILIATALLQGNAVIYFMIQPD